MLSMLTDIERIQMSVTLVVKYYVKTPSGRVESQWTGRADGSTESAAKAGLLRENAHLRGKEVIITSVQER